MKNINDKKAYAATDMIIFKIIKELCYSILPH